MSLNVMFIQTGRAMFLSYACYEYFFIGQSCFKYVWPGHRILYTSITSFIKDNFGKCSKRSYEGNPSLNIIVLQMLLKHCKESKKISHKNLQQFDF